MTITTERLDELEDWTNDWCDRNISTVEGIRPWALEVLDLIAEVRRLQSENGELREFVAHVTFQHPDPNDPLNKHANELL